MIVTLLTDFGTADYFVGAMKAAILSRDPRIAIIDITHDVPRHDIRGAAFNLLAVYADFPPGTVHVAVVDPGVGSERAAIAVRLGDFIFVGPDNGVFGYVLDTHAGSEARRIESASLHRKTVSSTFHGRDLFAPAGAALAAGFPFEAVGPVHDNPVRLEPLNNERQPDGAVHSRILHVDRFGNCVTSLRPEDLPDGADRFEYSVGNAMIREVRPFFASGRKGVPFGIWGSAEFFEIAVDGDSAAEMLSVRPGDPVEARRRD